RVDVDAVDLPREPDAVGQLEAALQLGCRPLRAEAHLEPPRDERQAGFSLVPDELLEVAPERLLELGRYELGELEAHSAAERVIEAAAEERHGLFDHLRRDALDAELLR